MSEEENLEVPTGGQHEAGDGLEGVVVEEEGWEGRKEADLESSDLVYSIVG